MVPHEKPENYLRKLKQKPLNFESYHAPFLSKTLYILIYRNCTSLIAETVHCSLLITYKREKVII